MENIILKLNDSVNSSRNQVFYALISALFFLCFSYVYLVNKAVFNIVERENAEESIIAISSKVGELESQYISLQKKISLDSAHVSGFVKASGVKFVSRGAYAEGLSLRSGI